MANKKQDLEEDFDENEELELNEDQDDKPLKTEASDDAADDQDDSDEDSSSDSGSDEDLEAKRERRRREKKMKRERERRERLLLRSQVAQLEQTIKELKENQGKLANTVTTVTQDKTKSELEDLKNIYAQANAVMEQAISDGDGKKFAEAKSISDRAVLRIQKLDSLKNAAKQETKLAETQQETRQTQQTEETVSLTPRAKSLGLKFVNKHKDWYDPNGGDTDSRIVMMLDAEIYNEGYSPDDPDYWVELEERCKTRLPHRFKTVKTKPKAIVGGSGKDSSSVVGLERSLPREFVQTLQAAGYWDDTKKRDAAIKEYYKNKQGA